MLGALGTALVAAPAQAATPHATVCPGSVTFNWDWNTSDFGFGFTEAHTVITITPCWTAGTGDIATAYASINTTKTTSGNLFSSDQFVGGSYQVTQLVPQLLQIQAVERSPSRAACPDSGPRTAGRGTAPTPDDGR